MKNKVYRIPSVKSEVTIFTDYCGYSNQCHHHQSYCHFMYFYQLVMLSLIMINQFLLIVMS